MNFKAFDSKMRKYEDVDNQSIMDNVYIVARLDGKGFHTWVRIHDFERPFDQKLNKLFVTVCMKLMAESGFKITYGYIQSDEISLLFDLHESSFSRKTRKIDSILASYCTAYFNKYSNIETLAMFDCRTIALPTKEDVVDYFLWRQEDSARNALNSYCYWLLRSKGYSKGKATSMLMHKSVSDKNELLFQDKINYNDLPNWQKRGVGVYYTSTFKEGYNWKTEQSEFSLRRQLTVNYELDMKQQYAAWLERNVFIDHE